MKQAWLSNVLEAHAEVDTFAWQEPTTEVFLSPSGVELRSMGRTGVWDRQFIVPEEPLALYLTTCIKRKSQGWFGRLIGAKPRKKAQINVRVVTPRGAVLNFTSPCEAPIEGLPEGEGSGLEIPQEIATRVIVQLRALGAAINPASDDAVLSPTSAMTAASASAQHHAATLGDDADLASAWSTALHTGEASHCYGVLVAWHRRAPMAASQALATAADTPHGRATLQRLRALCALDDDPRPALALNIAAALGWCPPFVSVRAGAFNKGASANDGDVQHLEQPAHAVTLSQPFLMAATPVTQAHWRAVMGRETSEDAPRGQVAVTRVSWFDALDYCQTLSARLGLPPAYTRVGDEVTWADAQTPGLRLPTEAEWEYAARAGDPAHRYGALDEIAWYKNNSGDQLPVVGSKRANTWGLFDTLGNVQEWCWDVAYRTYDTEPIVDPMHDIPGEERVLRGGSFGDDATRVRVSARRHHRASGTGDAIGFRPVCTHIA